MGSTLLTSNGPFLLLSLLPLQWQLSKIRGAIPQGSCQGTKSRALLTRAKPRGCFVSKIMVLCPKYVDCCSGHSLVDEFSKPTHKRQLRNSKHLSLPISRVCLLFKRWHLTSLWMEWQESRFEAKETQKQGQAAAAERRHLFKGTVWCQRAAYNGWAGWGRSKRFSCGLSLRGNSKRCHVPNGSVGPDVQLVWTSQTGRRGNADSSWSLPEVSWLLSWRWLGQIK